MKNTYQFYRERRKAVLQSMRDHSGGGLALVPTAPEVARNRDSMFPYRHDSYFYYLSGFPEPEALVALLAGPDGDKQGVLPRKNANAKSGTASATGPTPRARFSASTSHPIAALPSLRPNTHPTVRRSSRRSGCSSRGTGRSRIR
jgi:Xaa-Pro aminopeptidase